MVFKSIIGASYIFLTVVSFNVNATELVFATDGEANTIRVYEKSGIELGNIANQEFNFPTLLEGFIDGRHLITDINFISSGVDLVKVDLFGDIVARTSISDIFGSSAGGIVDVINSGQDTFFVTSTQNTQIAEIDSNLNLLRSFPSGAEGGGLRTLGGAISPNGSTLYIADADGQSGNGFIRTYDVSTGNQIDTLSNDVLAFPFMMDFNNAGELVVTDRGDSFTADNIFVFSDTLQLLDEFTSGAPITYNFGAFDLDDQDNIFLIETNFDTDSPIRNLTSDGAFISEFGDALGNPNSILVMSSVPIPAAVWLFGSGLLGLIGFARRKS